MSSPKAHEQPGAMERDRAALGSGPVSSHWRRAIQVQTAKRYSCCFVNKSGTNSENVSVLILPEYQMDHIYTRGFSWHSDKTQMRLFKVVFNVMISVLKIRKIFHWFINQFLISWRLSMLDSHKSTGSTHINFATMGSYTSLQFTNVFGEFFPTKCYFASLCIHIYFWQYSWAHHTLNAQFYLLRTEFFTHIEFFFLKSYSTILKSYPRLKQLSNWS